MDHQTNLIMVVRCILNSWGRGGGWKWTREPFFKACVFFYLSPLHHRYSQNKWIKVVFLLCIIRPVKGICGFSQETVVAVTTNIESMELRRCQSASIGYEKHPRAGTSDNVEGFIALFHRFLGVIFTVKELKALWPWIVRYTLALEFL